MKRRAKVIATGWWCSRWKGLMPQTSCDIDWDPHIPVEVIARPTNVRKKVKRGSK